MARPALARLSKFGRHLRRRWLVLLRGWAWDLIKISPLPILLIVLLANTGGWSLENLKLGATVLGLLVGLPFGLFLLFLHLSRRQYVLGRFQGMHSGRPLPKGLRSGPTTTSSFPMVLGVSAAGMGVLMLVATMGEGIPGEAELVEKAAPSIVFVSEVEHQTDETTSRTVQFVSVPGELWTYPDSFPRYRQVAALVNEAPSQLSLRVAPETGRVYEVLRSGVPVVAYAAVVASERRENRALRAGGLVLLGVAGFCVAWRALYRYQKRTSGIDESFLPS